jgi:flagellin
MVINHNLAALNTFNKLAQNTTNTTNSLEKLSSGLKINKAADDAAGLAISEKMKTQINGLDTAESNVTNGVSLIQTAEGALTESQSILQRMNELAVQASNGTNTSADDKQIQLEVTQLQTTLTSISTDTSFNTEKIFSKNGGRSSLINTNTTSGVKLQIGAQAGQKLVLNIGSTSVSAIGLGVGAGTTAAVAAGNANAGINLSTTSAAEASIATIATALNSISTMRAQLGAYQNQLTHTTNNLTTESSNLTSAESNITDVDMASEMTNYTKNNILVSASEAMLAQANQLPQGVLSLLK